MEPYMLELTDDDIRDIKFAGSRYGWSAALLNPECESRAEPSA